MSPLHRKDSVVLICALFFCFSQTSFSQCDTATLISDLRPGPAGSLPAEMIAFNGKLYCQENDGISGIELWSMEVLHPCDTNGNRIVLEEPVATGKPGMQFTLYPNPADDNVVVDYILNSDEGKLEVYDLLGRPVMEVELYSKSDKIQLPVKNWSAGYYLVELKNGKGKMTRRLVVIK